MTSKTLDGVQSLPRAKPKGSRFPVLETALTGVAAGSLGTLWSLLPSPYLTPTLVPYTLGVSTAWVLWCPWRLDRGVATWHRWHVSPAWVVAPAAMMHRRGALFGKGFRLGVAACREARTGTPPGRWLARRPGTLWRLSGYPRAGRG